MSYCEHSGVKLEESNEARIADLVSERERYRLALEKIKSMPVADWYQLTNENKLVNHWSEWAKFIANAALNE